MVRRKRDQVGWSNDDALSNVTFNSGTGGGPRGEATTSAATSAANPQSPPTWNFPHSSQRGVGGIPSTFTATASQFAVDSNAPPVGAGATSNGAFDNHSTYSTQPSQRSSSVAFDASSIVAACSSRPRKRQRTTLADALQSIELDRQIPEQIVPMPSCMRSSGHEFAFGNAMSSTPMLPENTIIPQNGQMDVFAGPEENGLPMDRTNSVEDGVIDDNSQLTASDVEDGVDVDEDNGAVLNAFGPHPVMVATEPVIIDNKNNGEGDDRFMKDSDDTSQSTSDMDQAHRQAMLSLFLENAPPSGVALPSIVRSAALSSGTMETRQDPVTRKIEDLFRQSLNNVKNGSHPLQLPTSNDGDDSDLEGSFERFETQDDMAVDPNVYNYRSLSSSMMTYPDAATLPYPAPIQRERSNSLPDSMEFDGEHLYSPSWNPGSKLLEFALAPSHAGRTPSFRSMSSNMSDVDMD